MLKRIEHRGKDARQIKRFKNVWLGHNRLAIVDLSEKAAQPLETDRAIIAFNGEIFNYQELWGGLELHKHHRPPPLNEIWMLEHLLRRHKQFDRLLDGYYGIVRIDKSRQIITVARDLIGVVPLYYQLPGAGRAFAIASEIKAFDAGADVREVMPGETLVFSLAGKLQKRRRFDPYSLHLEDMDYGHLEFLFSRAVRRRLLHADVPVCVALSGGLDSSMVLMEAHRLRAKISAITICVDSDSEEVLNARRFTEALEVEHQVVQIDEATITTHQKTILYHLEDYTRNPIKYAAMIRNYFTAMHAPGTVVLCGEGADEIGCGYPPHQKVRGLALEWKSLSTLRSMHAINLDRVNKGGLAFTKEFRTPFLDRALVLYMMGCEKLGDKEHFRHLALKMGIPSYILNKRKYTSEETRLWQMVEGW